MPARVTQEVVETSLQPSTGHVRVTQEVVETSLQPSTGHVRLTQVVVETSIQWMWVGTAAATLSRLNASASGSVVGNYAGTAAATLCSLSAAASGFIGSAGSFTGTEASTLKHLTASAAGLLIESGTAAATLKHVTVSASGLAVSGAAITLKRLAVSAAGVLGYSGTAAATLKRLAPAATGTAFWRNGTIAVTLKKLAVSASGVVLAPAVLSHNLYWKYNSRGGGPVVTWIKSYTGSRQVQVSRTVPAQTSDQLFAVSILQAATLTLTLYSTQDVTVYLSSGHTQMITLPAQQPIIWTSDSGAPFPFTSDVSALYVSNDGENDATFTVAALILDSSN